jgi:pimeloyl-ACP methyl ester carboxylesterase
MSTVFEERSVTVAGRPLAYQEAGTGDVIVAIGERGTLPSRALALLAATRRILHIAPGDAAPGDAEARRIAAALEALGVERFDLMAEGRGGQVALHLALERPTAVGSIVLLAPDALAERGGALEQRLREMKRPVLALFGTKDAVAPPESGDRYRACLPDCHLMFVYDAAHAIADERPEAVAFIAREFFERRDLFLVSRDSGATFP